MATDKPVRKPGQTDLARLAHLMHSQGWHAGADRMACDPIYFRERLALAHTSACDELRRLAVDLFVDHEHVFAHRFTAPNELLRCAP
jgi:hypothetical protein